MKITFEKKIWFEAKARLQNLFSFLTERDFQYEPGEESKVPERIRKMLHMSKEDFYKLTGLYNDSAQYRKISRTSVPR